MKRGHIKGGEKEEKGDLELEGVDQPEGEVHQDEETHCLSAGMPFLIFPKNTPTVWKQVLKDTIQLGGC